MAKNNETTVASDMDGLDSKDLLKLLVETQRGLLEASNQNRVLIQAVEAQTPIKKVTFGSKQYKDITAANPKGLKPGQPGHVKATREYLQNGARVNTRTLDFHEIAALEKLRPGKYIDGVVKIEVKDGAGPDEMDKVYIHYRNKSIEQRIANAGLWKALIGLCERCNQEADDAEELKALEAATR